MKHVEFNIPAVRGIQGSHAVYIAMCPIHLLPRLFPVGVDDSTSGVHQSFRKASMPRVREIAKDIVDHCDNYQIPAVTVSIEHEVRFISDGRIRSKLPSSGELSIPLAARLTILDGIHRIYGLQLALSQCPAIRDDSIAMLLHVDPEGSRRGQIFSDIRRYERSAARSLRISLDERDEIAKLTRDVIAAVPVFANAIDMEKTTISNRSRKLFTLSALYQANRVLLADQKNGSYARRLRLATDFWTEVAVRIPGWSEIATGETSAAEIRAGYVHCHAIGLAAIARAGRALLAQSPTGWKERLGKLSSLDWSRKNTKLWEGRAMIGGRLSKSSSAVARAGNAVKRHLGVDLTREEKTLETGSLQ